MYRTAQILIPFLWDHWRLCSASFWTPFCESRGATRTDRKTSSLHGTERHCSTLLFHPSLSVMGAVSAQSHSFWALCSELLHTVPLVELPSIALPPVSSCFFPHVVSLCIPSVPHFFGCDSFIKIRLLRNRFAVFQTKWGLLNFHTLRLWKRGAVKWIGCEALGGMWLLTWWMWE